MRDLGTCFQHVPVLLRTMENNKTNTRTLKKTDKDTAENGIRENGAGSDYYILIGKIVNVHGIQGEVKVYNYSDDEAFDGLEHIFLKKRREGYDEYFIKSVKKQKNTVILKLKGLDDRNEAEKLREREVYITEDDLRILPEDTYYIRDMIGSEIRDEETGALIGVLKDVLQGLAQDNYEVELPGGNITYIPAVAEFVKDIDIEKKVIKVKLIPGFIGDAVEA